MIGFYAAGAMGQGSPATGTWAITALTEFSASSHGCAGWEFTLSAASVCNGLACYFPVGIDFTGHKFHVALYRVSDWGLVAAQDNIVCAGELHTGVDIAPVALAASTPYCICISPGSDSVSSTVRSSRDPIVTLDSRVTFVQGWSGDTLRAPPVINGWAGLFACDLRLAD